MNRLALAVVSALALVACKKDVTTADPSASAAPSGAASTMGAPEAKAANTGGLNGKVLEKLDATPYVYLKLATAGGETWAAVPQANVGVGADVTIDNPMPMDGFESKTLNRKFDKIVFGTLGGAAAGHAAAAGGHAPSPMGSGMAAAAMGSAHGGAPAAAPDLADVKVPKAANGKTISEIYAQKTQLKDKPVTFRGKVVKSNSGILGKNWLHLRDGSGAQAGGDNDITATTDGQAAVGDVVVVTGTVRLDKDFGAGYNYPLIVEEAALSK